jgi:hypothetical protein
MCLAADHEFVFRKKLVSLQRHQLFTTGQKIHATLYLWEGIIMLQANHDRSTNPESLTFIISTNGLAIKFMTGMQVNFIPIYPGVTLSATAGSHFRGHDISNQTIHNDSDKIMWVCCNKDGVLELQSPTIAKATNISLDEAFGNNLPVVQIFENGYFFAHVREDGHKEIYISGDQANDNWLPVLE